MEEPQEDHLIQPSHFAQQDAETAKASTGTEPDLLTPRLVLWTRAVYLGGEEKADKGHL